MEQEIRRPDYVPRVRDRTSSTLNCFLAALGVTLVTACLFGAAAATSAWAVAKLMGFPDWALYAFLALVAIPVLWLTVWTAGRAWYLERRLASGKDVDNPVFKMVHYFSKAG
jgi:hypothetical protein